MAPSIPTCRPLFTAGRVAAAVALFSMTSALVMLFYAPVEAASAATVACAAPIGALR